MKRLLYLLPLLALSICANAQYTSSSKVKEYLKLATNAFEDEEYQECVNLYEKIDSTKRDFPVHHYRLGVAYLHSNHNELALGHLKAAEDGKYKVEDEPYLDFDVYHNQYLSPSLNFNIAWAYHLAHKFEKALSHYKGFRDEYTAEFGSGKNSTEDLAVIDHLIEQAQNGARLVKSPIDGIVIENLGPYINSEYEEIVPLISADEKTLIFTSRRPNTTGGGIDSYDDKYMEDIYMTKKKNGVWKRPWKISKKINTEEHDACIGLSPNGRQLLIYRNNKRGTGDIYLSELKGKLWSVPDKLQEGINTKNVENSASMSADERMMVFTSNRAEGSFGGEDLWVTYKNSKGEWEEPVNCGASINTEYDEDAPFVHPDGRTLYFSSKGHTSMGGFDIFKAKFDPKSKTFSKPENIGYPINTADNDIFFVWSPDGKRAYFASHREDSYGDQDIYMLTYPDASMSVILVKGTVKAKHNGEPLKASIVAQDNHTETIVHEITSNDETGEFIMILEPGRSYGITFERDGYLTHTEHIELPDLDKYYERELEIELQLLQDGSVTVLNNVFFENNKSELFEESHLELDRFVQLLNENPEMDAEVAGHTEIGGTKERNISLSQARGQAVCDYIASKGISKKRLRPVGYGAKYPISQGRTAEEKQKNRRTEIILHNREEEGKNWVPYYERQ